jgi:hypothetical protein
MDKLFDELFGILLMSIIGRKKIIERIAQQAATTAPAITGPTSVPGSPSSVPINTFFPSVSIAWGANNIDKIGNIVNILNQAIFVLSNGQMDFNTLRVAYFNVDLSKYPDQTLRAIIALSQVIYTRMLSNRGQPFRQALSPIIRQQTIMLIERSLNVSSIPAGGINQYLQTKVGNFKEVMGSILATIK